MDIEKLLNTVLEYMKEDCYSISFPEVVDFPKGIKQDSDCAFFDHEYVDQNTGISGDDHYGFMYFPIVNGKYLKVGYSA